MVLPVQNPESPYVTLKIDQGEGFSFAIDRVDEFQTDIKLMNVWGEDAAQQMKQVIDRNVLVTLAASGMSAGGGVAANITGYTTSAGPTLDQFTAAKGALVAGGTTVKGTALTVNSANGTGGNGKIGINTAGAQIVCANSADITKQILQYGQWLDENSAPTDGRFVVLPSVYMQMLKDVSLAFGQAYATGQNSANILTGIIPKIDRFDIIFSNNSPTGTLGANGNAIIFGQKYATTFATQITESRIIDNPFAFGKMMQGLQVYGFNVIKPQLLGVDYWKSTTA